MPVRIPRPPKPLAALLVAAALVVAGQGSARAALPTLYVTYTLKCTFTIADDSGKAVTSIAPGTYQVAVSTPGSFSGVDLSGITDLTACKGAAEFRLTGPGVNLSTSLNDGDGSSDVLSATFQPSSTYVAVDNNQPSVARVSFTTLASGSATGSTSGATTTGSTGSGTTTTKSSTGSTSTTIKGTLNGAVSTAGAVTLRYKGKTISTLAPGTYKVSVVDKSKKSGFLMQALHGATTTVSSAAAVGTSSATVNLKTGQWYFFASKTGKKTGFAVVGGLYG